MLYQAAKPGKMGKNTIFAAVVKATHSKQLPM